MSNNNGGPAFPVRTGDPDAGHQDGHLIWQFPGMTLRDHFAAKAMQALIAKGMEEPKNRNASGVPIIARFAYEYADAMLKERAK